MVMGHNILFDDHILMQSKKHVMIIPLSPRLMLSTGYVVKWYRVVFVTPKHPVRFNVSRRGQKSGNLEIALVVTLLHPKKFNLLQKKDNSY